MINAKDITGKFQIENISKYISSVEIIDNLKNYYGVEIALGLEDDILTVSGNIFSLKDARNNLIRYLYDRDIDIDIPNIYVSSSLNFIDDLKESTDFEDEQKEKFINNFGVILSQTREKIDHLSYDKTNSNQEFVVIHYKNSDFTKSINITCDSWASIIRDVIKVVS